MTAPEVIYTKDTITMDLLHFSFHDSYRELLVAAIPSAPVEAFTHFSRISRPIRVCL